MTLALCIAAYFAAVAYIAVRALYDPSLPYTRPPPWRRRAAAPVVEDPDESETLLGELERRQSAREPVDIEDVMRERFNRRWDRLEARRRMQDEVELRAPQRDEPTT